MDEDARVGQRASACPCAPPASSTARHRLGACPMQMVPTRRLDVLHGVVDGEAGVTEPPGELM